MSVIERSRQPQYQSCTPLKLAERASFKKRQAEVDPP